MNICVLIVVIYNIEIYEKNLKLLTSINQLCTQTQYSYLKFLHLFLCTMQQTGAIFSQGKMLAGILHQTILFHLNSFLQCRFVFCFLFFVVLFCFVLFFCFCFFFSRQCFSVQPWLSWNSFCRPGWPRTQKYACLCFPSAGIKGVCHHCPSFLDYFLKVT